MRLPFDLFCSADSCGSSHSSLNFQSLHPSRALNSSKTSVQINAANGNTVVRDTTFDIADDGVTLSLGMVWNSNDATWRWAAAKVINNGDTLTVIEPDGRAVTYTKKDASTYVCTEPDSEGLSTITLTNGAYQRYLPGSGKTETFDNNGHLSKIKLPNNKTIAFTEYDGDVPTSITLPSERVVKLTSVANATGKTATLSLNGATVATYDISNSNLTTSIVQPDNSNYQTKYSYTNNNLNISASDNTSSSISFSADGKFNQLTEGGRTWSGKYVDDHTFAVGASDGQQFVVNFDASKHLSGFKKPTDNKPTVVNDAGFTRTITDPDGAVHTYKYDPVTGLLSEATVQTTNQSVQYQYDTTSGQPVFGCKIAEVRKDGNLTVTTHFIYNNLRQQCYRVSPEGRVVRFEYNANGQLIAEKRCQSAQYPTANPRTLDDLEKWWQTLDKKSMQITTYGYDNNGRRNLEQRYSSVNADGTADTNKSDNSSVTKTYDDIGHTIQTVVATDYQNGAYLSQTATQKTDNLNRVWEVDESVTDNVALRATTFAYQGSDTTITHANGLIEKNSYDAGGLLSQTNRNGRKTINERNANGTLKCVTRNDGQKEYEFPDASGRLQYKVAADGTLSEFCYDERGQLYCQKDYSLVVANPSDPKLNIPALIAGNPTTLAKYSLYNTNKELRYEVTVKTVDNKLQALVTQHYYQLGNKVRTIQYATPLTDEKLADMSYTALSQMNFTLDDKDRSTLYFYDNDGNLVAKQEITDNQPVKQGYLTYYQYDGANNLSSEVVVCDKQPAISNFKAADYAGAKSLTTSYCYDNAGRKASSVDADGYMKIFAYYPNGKLKWEKSYYNKMGTQPFEHPNDKTIYYYYDALGRQTKISNQLTGLDILITYDAADNETSRTLLDTVTGEKRVMAKAYNVFSEITTYATPRVCDKQTDLSKHDNWFVKTIHPVTGLMLDETDALGNKTYYFYDAQRRPEFVIGADGCCTRYTYDPICGKPTTIYHFYTPNPTFLTQLKANTQRQGFNDMNVATQYQTDPHDKVTTKIYDEEGLQVVEVDPNGCRHAFGYNSFGQVNGELHDVDSNQKLLVYHEHDLRGNLTKTTKDPKGLNISTAREFNDPLNRATLDTSALGETIKTEYEGLRSIKKTDQADSLRVKTQQLDAFKRISAESDWNNSSFSTQEYRNRPRIPPTI